MPRVAPLGERQSEGLGFDLELSWMAQGVLGVQGSEMESDAVFEEVEILKFGGGKCQAASA